MNIVKTNIDGVLIIDPRLFREARGCNYSVPIPGEHCRTRTSEDEILAQAKLHSIADTAMKNGNSKFNAILAVVQL